MRGELLQFSNGAALITTVTTPVRGAARHDRAAGRDPGIRAASWPSERCANWARPPLHCTAKRAFAAKTGGIDWIIAVEGNAAQLLEGAASAGIPRDRLSSLPLPTTPRRTCRIFCSLEIFCW